MANKGGYTRLKRQMAPKFWKIERKHSRFVLKVHPGPHSKSTAYPLGVVLRDILKVCSTMREAEENCDCPENKSRRQDMFRCEYWDRLDGRSGARSYWRSF